MKLKTHHHNDSKGFYNQISGINNANHVCGLTPIYSLLELIDAKSCEVLKYGQWNEVETKSAVSFASAVFYS